VALIVDRKNGTIVDTETGEVVEDHIIDESMEWRAYSAEEFCRKARADMPTDVSYHDYGMRTYIYLDPPNKYRDAVSRHTVIRLIKAHRSTRVANNERRLVSLLQMLHNYGKAIGFSDEVIDEASIHLRKALETLTDVKAFTKRNRAEWILATLYLTAKSRGAPISKDEFLKNLSIMGLRIRISEFENAVRLLVNRGIIPKIIIDPRAYLYKYAQKLGLGQDAVTLASMILELAREENRLVGRKPSGVAAALLYLSAKLLGYEITQKQVVKATDQNEVVIRLNVWDVIKFLDIDVYL